MELRERRGKDGTLRFFIDWTVDGYRRRQSLKNIHDRKTAQVAFAEFQTRLARGQVGLAVNANLSLRCCLSTHVKAKQVTSCERHGTTLESYAKELLEYFGENKPARTLTESAVNEYRLHLQASGNCADTINRKVTFLQAALERAVRDGFIPKNQLKHLSRLSDRRPEQVNTYMEQDEVDRVLDVLRNGIEKTVNRSNGRHYMIRVGRNVKLYRLVVFLVNTGARLGEAFQLTWRDVNLDKSIVTLQTTKKAARGKRTKARDIPINSTLRELFDGMDKAEGSVFQYSASARSQVGKAFRNAVRLAGVKPYRVHDLRHTFASWLAISGVSLYTIKELLGHATLTMTMRYAHLCPSVKSEAVERLAFGDAKRGKKVLEMPARSG